MSGWVMEFISSFGLLAVAVLMVVENLFPPIPSELILPFAGFLVSQGELGFVPTLVVATLGSLLGAFVLYALGRWGGRGLVLRYGSLLRVKEADLERAERWFERYDEAVVFFGRMIPGLRSIVSIPAGMLQMPFWRFTLLTAAGAAVWDALLLGLGWYLGSNWRQVSSIAGSVSNVVLAVGFVVLVGLAIWWWRSK